MSLFYLNPDEISLFVLQIDVMKLIAEVFFAIADIYKAEIRAELIISNDKLVFLIEIKEAIIHL